MRATCASLFLASSFCSIEETMRHEARRAPEVFCVFLGKRSLREVSFSFFSSSLPIGEKLNNQLPNSPMTFLKATDSRLRSSTESSWSWTSLATC